MGRQHLSDELADQVIEHDIGHLNLYLGLLLIVVDPPLLLLQDLWMLSILVPPLATSSATDLP
jgi:hypothetical protein